MILVDTSVWIDHFHAREPELVRMLERNEVGGHPYVIEELALGSMKNRDSILSLLEDLRQFRVMTHRETIHLVEVNRLWGRGLSAVDVHLVGSVMMHAGAALWTRDKRLLRAASDLGVTTVDGEP